MNFLSLAKRLRQEAGISGTGPATVLSQTGEMLRVVDWILAAYEDIQNAHTSWRFLRTNFSFSTVDGQQQYTPAQAGVTDMGSWVQEGISLYSSAADEQFLTYTPWDNFKAVYGIGTHRTTKGRPTVVSVTPANSLALWQLPDAVYACLGEYYKTAATMTADADIPNIPARFHMAIVWKALMYYGAYAAADEKYAHGKNEFGRLMRQMELDQLEDFTYGEPLA
jgi:hypothetical protein